MAHSLNFTFVAGDIRTDHSFPISDDDWSLFSLYIREVQRLRQTKMIRSWPEISFTMSTGQPIGVDGLPEQGELAELLHCLRPFILEKERTSFKNCHATIGKLCHEHEAIKIWLKELSNQFHGVTQRSALSFHVFRNVHDDPFEAVRSNTPLNHNRYVQMWLNGFEYHRDESKRSELLELLGGTLDDHAKGVFVSYLHSQSNAILSLDCQLQKVLR